MLAQEHVVLVTEDGKTTGKTLPKLDAHHDNTPLHLGFSCYVFNDKNELLVTQRALVKKVWPGVWTNSVCGHPAKGETVPQAIERRLEFELGMKAADIQPVLPNYRYTTPPFKGIIENEFCPVYVAHAASNPKPNPEEVEALKWMSWEDFVTEASGNDDYSYWCKDQISQLKDNQAFSDFMKS